MALIKCSGCGHMISDKATKCPKCGCPTEKTLACVECGQQMPINVDVCPNCGCPIQREDNPSLKETNAKKLPKRKGNGIKWAIIALLLCVLAGSYYALCFYSFPDSYCVELVRYAEDGNAKAESILGDCYLFGNGVIKNYEEAEKWYQKSAAQGYPDALEKITMLGVKYFCGHDVEQDKVRGYKLVKQAAEKGHQYAKETLENMNEIIRLEQIKSEYDYTPSPLEYLRRLGE